MNIERTCPELFEIDRDGKITEAIFDVVFHFPGAMQRDYMQAKGITIKYRDTVVQEWGLSDFRERSKRKTYVINFCAPWVGHCQQLRPYFRKAAMVFEGRAMFANVNCEDNTHGQKRLCDKLKVFTYNGGDLPQLLVSNSMPSDSYGSLSDIRENVIASS